MHEIGKKQGGYSIGVFDPVKDNRANAYQLFNDGRLSFYAPADYSANSETSKFMKQIIDEVSAKESIKTECRILKQPAEAFKMKKSIENISKARIKQFDRSTEISYSGKY